MTWINVYSPIDILSSNFANVGNDQRTKVKNKYIGVEVNGRTIKPNVSLVFSEGAPQSLGFVDILTLWGFRAHFLYWGEEITGEVTCFHDIVKVMYEHGPILD